MDAINAIGREAGVPVPEDTCQAHGAAYRGRLVGSLVNAACFSFYPSTNLGAYGEAGALVSDAPEIARRARLLRDHGSDSKYTHSVTGLNGRMAAFQGAVLRAKLPYLGSWNERRRRLARLYDEQLADIPGCRPIGAKTDVACDYHLYVVRLPRRDAVREALSTEGISAQIHYPIPVHLQRAYAGIGRTAGQPTRTEKVATEILSLAMYPEMPETNVARVAAALQRALAPNGA